MKLQFDSSQDYQLDAVRSVVDLFEGQPLNKGDFEVSFTQVGAGLVQLEDNDQLLTNLKLQLSEAGVELTVV